MTVCFPNHCCSPYSHAYYSGGVYLILCGDSWAFWWLEVRLSWKLSIGNWGWPPEHGQCDDIDRLGEAVLTLTCPWLSSQLPVWPRVMMCVSWVNDNGTLRLQTCCVCSCMTFCDIIVGTIHYSLPRYAHLKLLKPAQSDWAPLFFSVCVILMTPA